MKSPSLRLWGWPIALGFLCATGLVSALLSDTWGDAWSWVGLGVPVAVMAWFGLRRRPGEGVRNPASSAPANNTNYNT